MLTKTGIEYLTHCWNFYTGCNHWKTGVCPVGDMCWARGTAHRFGRSFEPTLHPEKLLDPLSVKKPARIGVCFTGDLIGEWVDSETLIDVADHPLFGTNEIHGRKWSLDCIVSDVIFSTPHQYFFLTKNPGGYKKWLPLPDNAWVGATVCNDKMLDVAVDKLEDIQAKNKWLSFEPLMDKITLSLDYALYYGGISWVVIGGWSGGEQAPKIEWVREIVEACDKAGIPVWIKNNLRDLLMPKALMDDIFWESEKAKLRQELPEVSKNG